jgi:hypothetical protein
MQLHISLEIFALHVLERSDIDDAGIVNQDVDFTKAFESLFYRGLNLGAIEQVALDREDIAAAGSKLAFGAREFAGVTGQDRNASALLANLARNHQAKAARTAGNKRHFIPERETRRLDDARNQPKGDEQCAGEDDYAEDHSNEGSTFNPPSQGYGVTGAYSAAGTAASTVKNVCG